MKTSSSVLATIGFVLALVACGFAYMLNSKLEQTNDALKALQQSAAQSAAEGKQNAAAIDGIQKRINKIIDLVK